MLFLLALKKRAKTLTKGSIFFKFADNVDMYSIFKSLLNDQSTFEHVLFCLFVFVLFFKFNNVLTSLFPEYKLKILKSVQKLTPI